MAESKPSIAFLGPPGTYSHLVATRRFAGHPMLPKSGILDVCAFVRNNPQALGIVPIENSSGGTINETVDMLLDPEINLHIHEGLFLNVQLALLGHDLELPPKRLYSHFAPLEHCRPWIQSHLPGVELCETASTALAAEKTQADPEGAALCSRHLARRFQLKTVTFPVESSTPNITAFFVVASCAGTPQALCHRTTLSLRLQNRPGSLYQFLGAINRQSINLSRLVSRPIRGSHREYAFLLDLDADGRSQQVQRALAEAQDDGANIHICGTYRIRPPYKS